MKTIFKFWKLFSDFENYFQILKIIFRFQKLFSDFEEYFRKFLKITFKFTRCTTVFSANLQHCLCWLEFADVCKIRLNVLPIYYIIAKFIGVTNYKKNYLKMYSVCFTLNFYLFLTNCRTNILLITRKLLKRSTNKNYRSDPHVWIYEATLQTCVSKVIEQY